MRGIGAWFLGVVMVGCAGCGGPVVTDVPAGDRLTLDDGRTVVLIGVRAPQDAGWAKKAREALSHYVLGLEVKLVEDQNPVTESGETLAWVYVKAREVAEKNGLRNLEPFGAAYVWVNHAMVGEGMGHYEMQRPQGRALLLDRMEEAARKAREKGHGMWSSDRTPEKPAFAPMTQENLLRHGE